MVKPWMRGILDRGQSASGLLPALQAKDLQPGLAEISLKDKAVVASPNNNSVEIQRNTYPMKVEAALGRTPGQSQRPPLLISDHYTLYVRTISSCRKQIYWSSCLKE